MAVIDKRRKELGEFLQAIRKRGTPEEFGFPQGARRRTQGLRREEVAQLAGISATWYTWIEQGRDVNMSADALVRMANALKLTRTERAYLFDLAGRRDPQGHVPERRFSFNHIDCPAQRYSCASLRAGSHMEYSRLEPASRNLIW